MALFVESHKEIQNFKVKDCNLTECHQYDCFRYDLIFSSKYEKIFFPEYWMFSVSSLMFALQLIVLLLYPSSLVLWEKGLSQLDEP